MRNETINWRKQANDRITEPPEFSLGKRVDNFKYLWFDNLTEAAKIGVDEYKKMIEDFRKAYNERMKAPKWNIDKMKRDKV